MSLIIARFLLSRLESLSALLQVFQIFRGRAGRDCVFRVSLLPVVSSLLLTEDRHSSHRLAIPRINVDVFYCLVAVVPVAERPSSPVSTSSVRHLPRPTGLPPMAFVDSFRISLRRRENRPQTPQAKND